MKVHIALLEELELGVQPVESHLLLVAAIENLVDLKSVAQASLGGGIESTFNSANGLRAPVKEEQRIRLAAIVPDVFGAVTFKKQRFEGC